jgi:hypothetical protein
MFLLFDKRALHNHLISLSATPEAEAVAEVFWDTLWIIYKAIHKLATILLIFASDQVAFDS